ERGNEKGKERIGRGRALMRGHNEVGVTTVYTHNHHVWGIPRPMQETAVNFPSYFLNVLCVPYTNKFIYLNLFIQAILLHAKKHTHLTVYSLADIPFMSLGEKIMLDISKVTSDDPCIEESGQGRKIEQKRRNAPMTKMESRRRDEGEGDEEAKEEHRR
ncbi:hypothetical protein ALC62_09382, partial [Cyphomyrmex costatus]